MTYPEATIHQGCCLETLKRLPAESFHCVVTSPPYWGLRDYGCEGQIGLEASVEEHLANLVEVFREVRRVLRKDGTLWLNYGDAYACAPNGNSAASYKGKDDRTFRDKPCNTVGGGFKAKDLMGLPWRLALALQEPYYTGKIKREQDRIWLAAMIDAEGCLFIHKRKIGQENGNGYCRKSDSYGSGMEVANTSQAVVERCMEITGIGSICCQTKDRRQPLFRWNVRSNECRDIIREVYPYLVAKKHQARLLCGCPSSGPQAEAAHAGLIHLHNGTLTDVDFPAPASMFEKGWWLRSDVIWSKCNPMPESVTDRPTRSHEYLFLLTRSERYYYDADAIREPNKPGSDSPTRTSPRCRLKGIAAGQYHSNEGMPSHFEKMECNPAGRNKRTVWTIPTERVKLRDDLTAEQRAYVLGELLTRGLL